MTKLQTLESVGVNGTPPVEMLIRAVEKEFGNAGFLYTRNDQSYRALSQEWTGQTDDGRKHRDAYGREIFPFEGASDARPRTVEMVVNDEARLIKASFGRARLQAIPSIDTQRMAYARKVGAMLEHTRRVDMLPFLRREVGIYAKWRQGYGLALMGVTWEQERRLEMLNLTREGFHNFIAPQMDELNAMAAQQSGGAPREWMFVETNDLISDRLKEEIAVAWIREIAPLLDVRAARRVLADLRTVGSSMVPTAFPITNRPRWTALRPFVDVFFPTTTDDLQKARWIAHREMVSESELKDRVETQGYDKGFVEEALKQKGRQLLSSDWTTRTTNERRAGFGFGAEAEDTRNQVELMHTYYKTNGPGDTPAVMRTILNVAVRDSAAWHGVHDYAHGLYPYVAGQREDTRCLLDSRGLGELLSTEQGVIKTQIDARDDQTSMLTSPVTVTPSQRGQIVPQLRPGMRLQLRNPDDVKFLIPPSYSGNSIEIERSAEQRIDKYCGRMGDGVPEPVARLYAEDVAEGVLGEFTQCAGMTYALGCQFWTPEHMQAVAELEKPASAQEIRDMTAFVHLVFDVRDLNDEQLERKLKMWQTYVQNPDRFGVTDGAQALAIFAQSLDPWLASATMRSPEAAMEAEVKDEDQALIAISSGIEPDVAERGWNYQLRLEHLQQRIMANPNNRARYVGDEIYREMIDNRIKKLEFQIEQQTTNAKTGRQGAPEVLEKLAKKQSPLAQLAGGPQ